MVLLILKKILAILSKPGSIHSPDLATVGTAEHGENPIFR